MAENGGRKGSVFMIWPPKRALLRTRILKNNNNIHPVTQSKQNRAVPQVCQHLVLVPPKSESAKAKNYTAKFAVTGLDQA